MENPIKKIVQFNKEANLLEKGFNDRLESSFLVEEALECSDRLDVLFDLLSKNKLGVEVKSPSPKDLSRAIMAIAMSDNCVLTDRERLDKQIDAAVYAVGGCAKLNLTAQEIEASFAAVNYSNMKKVEAGHDEFGKLKKPSNWAEIEKLQDQKLDAILAKRKV